MKKTLTTAFMAVCAAALSWGQAVPVYLDDTKPIEERVEDALGRFASGEEIYDLDSLNRITSEVKEYILRNIGGYN